MVVEVVVEVAERRAFWVDSWRESFKGVVCNVKTKSRERKVNVGNNVRDFPEICQ